MIYRRGSTGEMVKQIQEALNLLPDGRFGVITEDAVKAFQKDNSLTVDGIVGPSTLARLVPLRFKKSKRRSLAQNVNSKSEQAREAKRLEPTTILRTVSLITASDSRFKN